MAPSQALPRRSASPPRTRIFHACQSCASSKVKCEGLQADGCARCRRRNTECSLAGIHGLEDGVGGTLSRRSREVSSRRNGSFDQPERQDTSINMMPFGHSNDMIATNVTSTQIDQMQKRIESLENAYHTLLNQIPSFSSIPPSQPFSTTTLSDNNSTIPMITPISSGSNALPTPQLVPSYTPQNFNPPPNNTTPQGIFIPFRSLDVAGFQKSYTKDPTSITFDESTRCAVDPKGFPDVVSRGYITRSQVETNFQLFKHKFSLIAPLIPFLLTTRSIPKHPFVILASLTFLPDVLAPSAMGLIEESILYAMTGPASVDVILALYILTFAPYSSSSEDHVPPTHLRLISLAYSIGVDLGLASKAEVMLGEDSDFVQSTELCTSDRLEELTLWEAIKNRYCIFRMESARYTSLPNLLSHRFPTQVSEHVTQCITHLQRERTVIEACRAFISALGRKEVTSKWRWPNTPLLSELWYKMKAELDELSAGLDDDEWLLRCTVSCIAYSLALRLGFLFLKPPSPISIAKIEEGESLTGISLVQISTHIIEHIVTFIMSKKDDQEIIPGSLLNTIVICLATSRRIVILTKNTVPTPIFDEALLLKAENFVARQPGLPGKVLREMWTSLEEPRGGNTQDNTGRKDPTTIDSLYGNGGHRGEVQSVWSEDGFNWDLFNFDFLFTENSLLPNTESAEME